MSVLLFALQAQVEHKSFVVHAWCLLLQCAKPLEAECIIFSSICYFSFALCFTRNSNFQLSFTTHKLLHTLKEVLYFLNISQNQRECLELVLQVKVEEKGQH